MFNEKEVTAERRKAIKGLFEELGDRYFIAPAALKKDYHSCFPSGLAYHSLNVTKLALTLNEALETGVSNDSIVIVGLLHDLGKIGSVGENPKPYCKDQTSSWHRDKLGQLYIYNDELKDGLTVPQRSLRILQAYGVDLSDSEYTAILYHDGLYLEQNRTPECMYSKDALMRIIQMADSYSALVLEI